MSSDFKLIIFNDDVNTFDDVIELLINCCGHTDIQAEQCASIIHNNGKATVKIGNEKFIRRIKHQFLSNGVYARMEQCKN